MIRRLKNVHELEVCDIFSEYGKEGKMKLLPHVVEQFRAEVVAMIVNRQHEDRVFGVKRK